MGLVAVVDPASDDGDVSTSFRTFPSVAARAGDVHHFRVFQPAAGRRHSLISALPMTVFVLGSDTALIRIDCPHTPGRWSLFWNPRIGYRRAASSPSPPRTPATTS